MSQSQEPSQTAISRWLYWGAWVIAIVLVGVAAYLGWRVGSVQAGIPEQSSSPIISEPIGDRKSDIELPELSHIPEQPSISRQVNLHTIIPTRPRQDPLDYSVDTGDSVFAIAKDFGLTPESVLWANYDVLNDNPDQLSPGMSLNIPPTDGVLYEWQEGDTLQGVADRFEAKVEDLSQVERALAEAIAEEYMGFRKVVEDGLRKLQFDRIGILLISIKKIR